MGGRARVSAVLVLVLLFQVIPSGARAEGKHLGVYGRLYEIREEDMLAYVRRKAAEIDPTALRKKAMERARKAHAELSSVSLNVPQATEERVRFVDPSVNVRNPLLHDRAGRIISRGEILNPLDYVPLSKPILVLREDQIRSLIGEITKREPVIILTDGDIRRASSLAGRMVYKASPFVLKRLGIEKTPSLITQTRRELRVKEMVLK